MNNSEIAREARCSRGTVIDVLKRLDDMDPSVLHDKSDLEIHRLLHPPLKREKDYLMPDMGEVIFKIGMPKYSIAKVWAEIAETAAKQGKKCYSKVSLQTFVRELKDSYIPVEYENSITVALYKNVIERTGGTKLHLLLAKTGYGKYLMGVVLEDLKPRTWIKANTRLLHCLKGCPLIYRYSGRLPKAWKNETDYMLSYYGMKLVSTKGMPVFNDLINDFCDAINDVENNEVSPQYLLNSSCDRRNLSALYSFSVFDHVDALMIEQKLFSPLPDKRYEAIEVKQPVVQMNFHMKIDGGFYSVPFALRHEKLTAKISDSSVEIYLDDVLVCVHDKLRADEGKYRTDPEHMPASDDDIPFKETSGRSLRKWARSIGQNTFKVINYYLKKGMYEAYGYIVCTSILHQGTEYGKDVLEDVCRKEWAITKGKPNYNTILMNCKHRERKPS